MSKPNADRVKSNFLSLQDQICTALQRQETATFFIEDDWERAEGGGGRTRVLEEGVVIEKGGVNFSHVYGDNLPPTASAHRPELAGYQFQAMGVSLVIHPRNPYVPTSHMNVRFFMAEKPNAEPIWWFGGGFDLTPFYGFKEDCQHWHRVSKAVCDPFDLALYPRFKKWCDDYFFLTHRNEPRGVGGLFFDDFNSLGFDRTLEFVNKVGQGYIDAYCPIIEKRKNIEYGERQRQFQMIRRGRYVEFNLVFDRGTLFGLQSGGRTESILMSLPPMVSWKYNWTPELGSAESELTQVYLKPQEWI